PSPPALTVDLINDMAAGAVIHGGPLRLRERTRLVIIPVPNPAVLVVNRDPIVAARRMVAARMDYGHVGHDLLRDAPVVFSIFGVPTRADQKTAGAFNHLEMRLHVAERVIVAFRADVEGIIGELAAMQPGAVAGIDASLERLQP